MFTEKYVFYYKVGVYFFSIIFCIIVYFPTMDWFSDVSFLMLRQQLLNALFKEALSLTYS